MPRWVDVVLWSLAVIVAAVVLFERSDAPFANRRFTTLVANARSLPPPERLAALPHNGAGLIDSIDAIAQGAAPQTVAGKSGPFRSRAASPLSIDGWAIDSVNGTPAAGIVALVDGRPVGAARTARSRPDVAAVFKNPGFVQSGFHLDLPAGALAPGTHRLSFLIVDARRDAVEPAQPVLTLEVQGGGSADNRSSRGVQMRIARTSGKA